MKRNKYAFIAVFTYEENGISIEFPDLPGCLPCTDSIDSELAVENAKEAMGLHLCGMMYDGEAIPEPTPLEKIEIKKNQMPVLISIDIDDIATPDDIATHEAGIKEYLAGETISHEDIDWD